MSQPEEVREVLNQTRMAISEVRVAFLKQAKREMRAEELALELGIPVTDILAWIQFLDGRGQA